MTRYVILIVVLGFAFLGVLALFRMLLRGSRDDRERQDTTPRD